MAVAVYILCGLTSALCAGFLLRDYRVNRVPVLFWSGLCFVGLTLNNIILILDLAEIPVGRYAVARNLAGACAVSLLLYGLLWKRGLSSRGEGEA